MQYTLLIYEAEDRYQAAGPQELEALTQAHIEFTNECIARGVFVSAAPLQPTATATTVRIEGNRERMVTDGPFAETREQLGGYYLLECSDLDEALEFARKLPVAVDGSIEVRPVMEIAGPHNPAGDDPNSEAHNG